MEGEVLKALYKNSMESTLNSTLKSKSLQHFLHYQSPNIIKSPNTGKTIKSTTRIGQDEDDGHVSIWAKLYTKRNQMNFLQLSIQNIHRLCCCGGLTQVSPPLVLFSSPAHKQQIFQEPKDLLFPLVLPSSSFISS